MKNRKTIFLVFAHFILFAGCVSKNLVETAVACHVSVYVAEASIHGYRISKGRWPKNEKEYFDYVYQEIPNFAFWNLEGDHLSQKQAADIYDLDFKLQDDGVLLFSARLAESNLELFRFNVSPREIETGNDSNLLEEELHQLLDKLKEEKALLEEKYRKRHPLMLKNRSRIKQLEVLLKK